MFEKEKFMEALALIRAIMRDGHFVYTSGRHGTAYVNKDAIYPHIPLVETVAREMARRSPGNVQLVAGPAMGGVILSTHTAAFLSRDPRIRGGSILSVYADKEDGDLVFKRGYDRLISGRKVLVVEDIVTTGGSLMKTADAARHCGGEVVGAIALCNRGGKNAAELGLPMFSALIDLPLESWAEEDCPMCRDGMPINTTVGKGAEFLRRRAQN